MGDGVSGPGGYSSVQQRELVAATDAALIRSMSPKGQRAVDATLEKLCDMLDVSKQELFDSAVPKDFSQIDEGKAQELFATTITNIPLEDLNPGITGLIYAYLPEEAEEYLRNNDHLCLSEVIEDPYAQQIRQALATDIKQLWRKEPAKLLAGLTIAAGALGYVAYSQGSDGLRAMGIEPEVSLMLFNGRFEPGVSVDWAPQLENFSFAFTADLQLSENLSLGSMVKFCTDNGYDMSRLGLRLDQGPVSAEVSYTHRDEENDDLEARLGFSDDGQSLAATYGYDETDHWLGAEGSFQVGEQSSLVAAGKVAINDPEKHSVELGLNVQPNPSTELFLEAFHKHDGSQGEMGVTVGGSFKLGRTDRSGSSQQPSARDEFNAALEKLVASDWNGAAVAFSRFINHHPNHPDIYRAEKNLALALLEKAETSYPPAATLLADAATFIQRAREHLPRRHRNSILDHEIASINQRIAEHQKHQ